MFPLFANIAYAQGEAGSSSGGTGGLFSQQIMLLICIFGIFYFLLIRPQQQQRKRHQLRLSQLTKGDKVVTAGGIHGTVVGTKDAIVVLKIAENVKIEVQKATISAVLDSEGETESKGA
ncbi:MAG: preprotein translocase subunit YajC [bacterium]